MHLDSLILTFNKHWDLYRSRTVPDDMTGNQADKAPLLITLTFSLGREEQKHKHIETGIFHQDE